MITFSRPSDEFIRSYLAGQTPLEFSYEAVRGTRGDPPNGYDVDHNRICLGHGAAAYHAACDAIRHWEMFHLDWLEICWPDAPHVEGTVVAMLMQKFGLWWLNACRIAYLINESDGVDRFGFAYGTLPDHVEEGEERFMVEWNHTDDSVWYDLLAFSRPRHLLARIGYLYVRHLQRRFATDSKTAMLEYVQETLKAGRESI